MNTRIFKIGGSIFALALVAPAIAADTTLPAKNASGTTVQLRVQDDASTLTPAHTVRCVASPTTDCIAQPQATAGSDATTAVAVQGITGGKAIPVTVSSSALPTGAATAAKQPALGTAGTASSDVITVQGIASGTNLNVNCQVGCSGGTSYTEDAAAAADPVGLAVISRRRDTMSTSEVSADGDNIGLISTNKGELRINDNSLNTAIGTTADSAWASGSGSAISLLKTIATASLDTSAATVKIDQTTPGTTNAVALTAGTALVGKVGIDQTTVGTTNAVSLAQIGANTVSSGNGTSGTGTLRVSIASDSTGQVALAAGTATVGATFGFAGTATTTITRPADASAYTANDAFADSTSAPTTGGFTLSSMCRTSGGSGVITDATIIYSTSSSVSGTFYIYDSAPTAQNDNAAWSVSDSDQLKLVGTIPFVTVADGVNAVQNVQNLNMGYTCSGSANLRYMVKITTGYTPASGDTLTLRAKFVQTN